jgi:hypothetical protein
MFSNGQSSFKPVFHQPQLSIFLLQRRSFYSYQPNLFNFHPTKAFVTVPATTFFPLDLWATLAETRKSQWKPWMGSYRIS